MFALYFKVKSQSVSTARTLRKRSSTRTMSDSDEEEEVKIEKGDEHEYFSVEDANNAMKIKERFCLSTTPACVYKGRKKKREHYTKRGREASTKKCQFQQQIKIIIS